MPAIDRQGGQALAEDRLTRCPSVAPENDRICEKVVAPTMMNRIIAEIAAVPRSACDQRRQRERAVGERQRPSSRARRARPTRSASPSRPTSRRPRRRRSTPAAARRARTAGSAPSRRAASIGAARRERRVDLARARRCRRRRRREDQPGHDAADQQLRDRDAGEAPSSTVSAEGGISMSTAPIAMIGPVAMRRVIAARQHHRQHQRAEHRRGRDGRAGDRREHRAGDDRDDREPARHLRDQPLDAVDHLDREAGVEQHLAHQHEERDRRQREARSPRLTLLRASCARPGSPPRNSQAPTRLIARKENATGRPRKSSTVEPPRSSQRRELPGHRGGPQAAPRPRRRAARARRAQAGACGTGTRRRAARRRPAAAPAATIPA